MIVVLTVPLIPVFMVLVGRLTEHYAAERLATLQRLGGQVLDLLTQSPDGDLRDADVGAGVVPNARERKDAVKALDTPVGEQGDAVLGDTLTHEDPALDEAEARVMLLPAVRALPERDRRVLYLRFFKQQTQSQIAEQIGVTQMQVSRILSRVLAQLRNELQ